jgi:hypothetical protein
MGNGIMQQASACLRWRRFMSLKRRFAQQDELGHFGSYEVTGAA